MRRQRGRTPIRRRYPARVAVSTRDIDPCWLLPLAEIACRNATTELPERRHMERPREDAGQQHQQQHQELPRLNASHMKRQPRVRLFCRGPSREWLDQ
jgi:hypothetical protein